MLKAFIIDVQRTYIRQPLAARLTLLLACSVFLPLWVTVPVILSAVFFYVRSGVFYASAARRPYALLYAALGFLLLAVPIFYRNYAGLGCGLLLVALFIVEFSVGGTMSDDLFALVVRICCGLSFFSAGIALAERLTGWQERAAALTNNANYYAYLVEILTLICLYRFVTTKKILPLAAAAVNLGALTLTGCRSAWVALLIGLFVFAGILKDRKMKNILILTVFVLGAAVYFFPNLMPRYDILDDSMTNRFYIWSESLKDFSRHPLFGRGLLAYFQVSGSTITPHAHNIYIDMLESTGITGTAIMAILFLSLVRQLVLAYRRGDADAKARVALCGSIVAATLIHGLTDSPILGFQTSLLLTLCLSMRPKVPYAVPVPAAQALRQGYALNYKR